MEKRVGFLLAFLVSASMGCGPRRIEKQPVAGADRIRAIVLAGEGDQLMREGKDHLALIKYVEASTLFPYHEAIFNKLGIVYTRLQQTSQAKKAVRRSMGLNPKYASAHNTMGFIQLAEWNYKRAVRSFEKALELLFKTPMSDQEKAEWAANFYLNLGYAHVQNDQDQQGLAAYRKALELNPRLFDKDPSIQIEYASPASDDPKVQFRFCRLFASLGNKEKALRYLDRALSAGLKETEKLLQDSVFEDLRQDQDFIQLLLRYGITLT